MHPHASAMRSPGRLTSPDAARIDALGYVLFVGTRVNSDGGVRPVLWLRLQS